MRTNPNRLVRMTLKEWLSKTGTTQEEFAEISGIPQDQVSKYASLKRRPKIDKALAIERATKKQVPIEVWARKKSA